MGVEQFVDEPGGLDFVQDAYALAEAFDGKGFNVSFVELVFLDEFQDQILLLVRAFPGGAALPLGDAGGLAWITLGGIVGGWVHAVIGGRNETRVEDLFVHAGLEALIETAGFGGDIVGGHQLGLNGDGELVGRVAGEPETFGVVCNEFDGHGVMEGLGFGG